ncbi:MAG: hypothetical protein HYW25_02040 [Candidatus Aenigmarchaeota archaeon]|nr:hypothetical protein [Candidatus Aenigmarchaeota archaeon]
MHNRKISMARERVAKLITRFEKMKATEFIKAKKNRLNREKSGHYREEIERLQKARKETGRLFEMTIGNKNSLSFLFPLMKFDSW